MKNNISLYKRVLTKDQLVNKVRAEFKQKYGNEPKNITLTPGRINIIGEHTDYNDGLAMPAAIDRWICAAICKSSSASLTIYSLNYNDSAEISYHIKDDFQEIWKQLATAAINVIKTEFGIERGAKMTIGGNIPIGCGLSSSSAFVISITQTICHFFSIQMKDTQLAHLCQKIENLALGTAVGCLDQYGIILSKKNNLLVIDFFDNSIKYIPGILNKCSWIVVNSQVHRELSKSAYIQRVNECKEGLEILQKKFNISTFRDIDFPMLQTLIIRHNVLYKRLCHVIGENGRVMEMQIQLEEGNKKQAGQILQESHKSLKILYEVSCKEIDYTIKLSENFDGWYGGRIIGGGFGGCSIHLIAHQVVEDYRGYITSKYSKKYKMIPDILPVTFPGGLQYL